MKALPLVSKIKPIQQHVVFRERWPTKPGEEHQGRAISQQSQLMHKRRAQAATARTGRAGCAASPPCSAALHQARARRSIRLIFGRSKFESRQMHFEPRKFTIDLCVPVLHLERILLLIYRSALCFTSNQRVALYVGIFLEGLGRFVLVFSTGSWIYSGFVEEINHEVSFINSFDRLTVSVVPKLGNPREVQPGELGWERKKEKLVSSLEVLQWQRQSGKI